MSYAIREALSAFRRAPLLTGLAAGMVGLALFVVGLFGLVAFNLQTALDTVEERVEIVAYLRDDTRTVEVDLAREELSALPEVASVTWVTKAEALEQARLDLPQFDSLFTDLAVNPLPASLEVTLDPAARNTAAVERITAAAGAYPFVEEATYGGLWVDRVFALRRVAGATAGIIGLAFAIVAALIIGTALRIAIFARRDEIYVMRLVGAKDGFIRRPFVLEGAITGLLGGCGALLLTWVTWRGFSSTLFAVDWIPVTWIAAGVAAGTVFGAVASALAVRRHLREVA